MDKSEDETWENYAFRHNLIIVKYTDTGEIEDILIPINSDLGIGFGSCTIPNNDRYIVSNTFTNQNRPSFTYIIQQQLYNLSNKYKLAKYVCNIDLPTFITITQEHIDDIDRQEWLFAQFDYWLKKEEAIIKHLRDQALKEKEYIYKNIFEIKRKISQNYSAELDELLSLLLNDVNFFRTNLNKQYTSYADFLLKKNEFTPMTLDDRDKRIELYQTYKNK